MEKFLQSVAVIGAAGKMGNGIATVLLEAMAKLDARRAVDAPGNGGAVNIGVPGTGRFELVLIDRDWEGLKRLKGYLQAQTLKFAEKNIAALRDWAKHNRDLIENGEIIEAFVDGAMSMVRFETHVDAAREAKLVFEAVFEDLDIKGALYAQLKDACSSETYFLSNTSSIPISALSQKAGLDGRLIGFHFYNPPAVQKLVEVIAGEGTKPALISLASELGKALGKTLVNARDVAGFIGNGHFIREGLFALGKYKQLRGDWDEAEAVLMVNTVTQDFLVRPMGMFQLIDYVGLDVFQMILKTMGTYLKGESFASDVIDKLLLMKVRGGQAGSGEQKDGFFQYQRNRITGVFHSGENRYVPLVEKGRFNQCLQWVGQPPTTCVPWAKLSKSADKEDKLKTYFAALADADGHGARMAREFFVRSREISEALVASKVANTPADVKTVLMTGFFHLYGPMDSGF